MPVKFVRFRFGTLFCSPLSHERVQQDAQHQTGQQVSLRGLQPCLPHQSDTCYLPNNLLVITGGTHQKHQYACAAPLPRRVFTSTRHSYLFEHQKARFVLPQTMPYPFDPNLPLQNVEPTTFFGAHPGCSATTTSSSTAAIAATAAAGCNTASRPRASCTPRRWVQGAQELAASRLEY